MTSKHFIFKVAFCLALITASASPLAFAQVFETPPTLKAADILPKKDLTGPDYRIESTVFNDGYVNTYMLRSKFGDFSCTSTAVLYTRIAELSALEKMAQLNSTKEFGGALANKGKQTVQGAVNLVTDPVNTIGGTLSGIGKIFVRAEENLVESNPSKYEDSRFQGITGFSSTKRDYAKQFGVDPYSTNPVLQQSLNDIASAGYAGRITGSALQALIPGGAGLVVSGVSGSAMLGDFDVSVPPADLRKQNRESLVHMGVPGAVARLFINNEIFTPTQQTLITKALSAMPQTKGKDDVVEFMAGTTNQDSALFRQRLIQMYAGYDRKVAPLERFVELGRFIGAMKANGTVILAFPLDYLVCTSTNDRLMDNMDAATQSLGAKGVELWITGKASPMTKKLIKRLGWKLQESGAEKLLGTWY